MKKLTNKTLARLATAMSDAAEGGPAMFNPWYAQFGTLPAVVEFPTGELTNPAIRGYVWAWGMKGVVKSERIGRGDRFSAQGLEGKIVIETQLTTALNVWRELGAHRCQVRARL